MSATATRSLSVLVAAGLMSLFGPATWARAQTTDLSAAVQAPATANLGDPVAVVVTVANEGGDASAAQATVNISPNLTVGTVPAECQGQGVYECTLGFVTEGNPVQLTFETTASASGPAPEAAVVIATSALDTNPTNNAGGTVTVVGGGSGGGTTDLTIDKTADPSPAFVKQDLSYTITVTNNSESDSAAQLTDLTLGAVTFVSVSSDGANDSCSDNSSNGLLVTCSLDTIAAGQTRTITLHVQPDQPLPITNTATVLPTGALDTNPTDNVKIVVTQVQEATATPPPSPSPTASVAASEGNGSTPSGGVQTGAGGAAGGSRIPALLLGTALAAAGGLLAVRRRGRIRG